MGLLKNGQYVTQSLRRLAAVGWQVGACANAVFWRGVTPTSSLSGQPVRSCRQVCPHFLAAARFLITRLYGRHLLARKPADDLIFQGVP
ncbi:hypothetical protein ALP03_04599 [Pseudomonas amygdali pv. tabaci]|uniref:Uncharacterized protein n=1 Tax=Pseudomonas amygdali pv. tabaci TaxID=322 RepID=A0A3M6G275_PSEAJ|nr:hypothetical protein ALP03_04599 [Pseudomonas amygdali pv. tabaci]